MVAQTPTPSAAAQTPLLHVFLSSLSTAEPVPEEHQIVSNVDASRSRVYQEYKRQKELQRLVNLAAGATSGRDSQARRNKLGLEGSRRRRRQENDTFAHHPLIRALDPTSSNLFDQRDMYPGPQMPQPAAIFSRLPQSIRSTIASAMVLDTAVMPSMNPHYNERTLCRCTRSVGSHALSKADRLQISKGLKKWGEHRDTDLALLELAVQSFFDSVYNPVVVEKDENMVPDASSVEEEWVVINEKSELPDFSDLTFGKTWTTKYATPDFEKSKSGEDGWCQVVNKDGNGKGMSLIIRDQFLKVAIHLLAKFYGLKSNSVDDADSGERITHLNFYPNGKNCYSDSPEEVKTEKLSSAIDCLKDRSKAGAVFLVPEGAFTTFFFQR
ncbi:hypothetical protein BCR33DRAFT_722154 [Rhizoclosmatium globosum]|uniref:Uncharacterized protein n=1 Tax=Rhizoclosmatium globosum TaxID=329046 RepID=A0A1Y2BNQ3_9FUNG|nr:hypothetical protein BCR33DRAFT_722154 [Rhizoclosmatium globosum]|eukprot:ORY36352.1 hypothetical protein BCR33DRAFT_722154 [Rhizoclosmatium globosum]